MFINAESEAEYPGARSMHEAQKTAAPNMVKPAANAMRGSAISGRAQVVAGIEKKRAESHAEPNGGDASLDGDR